MCATELHQTLQLLDHHYGTNVRRWLHDIYQFAEGIRRPEHLSDYAKRITQESRPGLLTDYYLSLELAKLIVLHSKSRVKLKIAKYLDGLAQADNTVDELDPQRVLALMELTKAMSLVSCQMAAEKRHLRLYEQRNNGDALNWWRYRAHLLGYSNDSLRRQLGHKGIAAKGKTQRDMLLALDPQEMIRTGVFDLFMAEGKDERYARQMADLAKAFAKEMKVEVSDDRRQASLFAPQIDPGLVAQLREPLVEMRGAAA